MSAPMTEKGLARNARKAERAVRAERTTIEVMADWEHSKNRRRARVAREYFDAYESGQPMSEDDR